MIKVGVELLAHTIGVGLLDTLSPEHIIEYCGREAYGSEGDNTIDGARRWITKRKRAGEWDVLEHASATFLITCSRVASHEIVRHRLASYTQQSMRFREPKIDEFLVPDEVTEEDVLEWVDDYNSAYLVFQKWMERGYKRQTARYHLPLGSGTRIACTWNFRTILHILNLRGSKKAQPEVRQIAKMIEEICMERWPGVFTKEEIGVGGRE